MTSIKRVIIYSFLVFVLALAALNFRFIFSQIKFYLNDSNKRELIAEFGPYLLPVTESTGTVLGQASSQSLGGANADYILNISSLDISAPIIYEPSTNPGVIYSKLQEGVVHYGPTPMPGEEGTAIILGHSSAYPWYRGNYGSVFALLGKLKQGDIFYIESGGQSLRYRVSESLIFSPFGDRQLAKFEQTDGSSVILVSCWPVGTNYKRLAVKADLI